MSFLGWLFGEDDSSEPMEIAPQEAALTTADCAELAEMRKSASRSEVFGTGLRLAARADALIPAGATAAQAATEYSMAIVKFPEGVNWSDLCVRHSDGWNLLSSLGANGDWNPMAAIKQAGLQPAAIANLALQGGAIVVGQAYMAQISSQLDGIQGGIDEIQRQMGWDRDANLKAGYDKLFRLTSSLEEYAASSEKYTVGLQIIEDAMTAADTALNYQISAICEKGHELASKKRLDEGKIRAACEELAPLEERAAVAFRLFALAQEVAMAFDNDYSAERIERVRSRLELKASEYASARGGAHNVLSASVAKLKGVPFKLAERMEDDFVAENLVQGIAHEVGANLKRFEPARMHRAAKEDLADRRGILQDRLESDNRVSAIMREREEHLDKLDFAFNKADAMIIDRDRIELIKSGTAEAEVGL